MTRQVFEHRSSRVIAASRLVMALLLGVWGWLDPGQPVRGGAIGQTMLVAYVGYAIVMLSVSWSDWRLDFRLTWPAFLLDWAAFLAASYFTENSAPNFVSPYMALFVFLTFSVAMRCSWRVTLLAVGVVGLSYCAAGWLLEWMGLDVDPYRFLRRVTYMVLLAVIITWLSMGRSAIRIAHFAPEPTLGAELPFAEALDYAREVTGAKGASLAWVSGEEPRTRVQQAGALGEQVKQLPPDAIDMAAKIRPMLFDTTRNSMLVLDRGEALVERSGTPEFGLAHYLAAGEGLLVPVFGDTGEGQLLLTGIEGMCRDDVAVGLAVAREIAHGLDHAELAAFARETALKRMRTNLARDLHDSVAQSLAGASFRLEALANLVRAGADPLVEIEAIKAGIRAEMGQVRAIIERLRRDEITPGARNLAAELSGLLESLARQWQVDARISGGIEPVMVPAGLLFEIQQLVREAMANAVRHGGARQVVVSIASAPGRLDLAVCDDGRGFPEEAGLAPPRSIAERVSALGGTLAVLSRSGNTRIAITLPMQGSP